MEESLPLARTRTATLTATGDRVGLAHLTYRRVDGSPFSAEAAAACVQLDGQIAVQVVFRDVTERRRTELALQARTAELETVLDTVPIAVWLAHDPDGRRISGNRAAASRLRLAATDNLSLAAPEPERPRHFRVYHDGVELAPERLPLQRAARGELVRNDELRVRFDDGTYYDELCSASPVRDASGDLIGAVGAAVDITERKAAEEQIRHRALHDPLTDLPNRALFHDRLTQAISRAHRSERACGGDAARPRPVQGDQRRAGPSGRRRSAARGRQTPDLGRARQRHLGPARRRRVRAGAGGPAVAGGRRGDGIARACGPGASRSTSTGARSTSAGSIGVTIYPADGDSPERLIRNADVALYRAKAAGRGRFEPYRSELDREMRRGIKVQRELRRALEQDGLELVYQPVFELPRQRLVKTEALLRIRREDGGDLSPSVFIPQAESSGLIHPLGEWVLRRGLPPGSGVAGQRASR